MLQAAQITSKAEHDISALARCLVVLAFGLVLGVGFNAPALAADDRLNIVFIAVDDLNDWVGPLGGHPQGAAATPYLQAFADRAMVFTNAHCPAPSCNPSRSAIMLGLRPSTTGILFNGVPQHMETIMRADRLSLPKYFRQQGYAAHGAGKLFHSKTAVTPEDWDTYLARPWEPRPPEAPFAKSNSNNNFDFAPYEAERDLDKLSDVKVADFGIERITGFEGDQPLFLGVGIFRPHLPWYAPQEFFDRFPLDSIKLPELPEQGPLSDLDDVPPIGKVMAVYVANVKLRTPDPRVGKTPGLLHQRVNETNEWAAAIQGYLASMAYADSQYGRVLDALWATDAEGRYVNPVNWGNSIVVLWGDHGYHFGEKTAWRKFTLWENATRVPLLVHVPGMTEPGTTTDAPVNLLDLFPTLVDLTGLPEVEGRKIPGAHGLEGRSLRPLLTDVNADWPHVSITENGAGNVAVRDRRFRYIRYSDGTEELYDHSDDPHEWVNLADDPAYTSHKQRLASEIP
ncbi:MAG: sulfatase [Planctomycetota bacterium]